ncbi:hypothetical protein BGI41_06915 [Methanobrevibacter sp. 87.7]|uniref:hypothetical protein n=1 Tax=Methanobrevibacter sp. 87.7 TaxID=387957 RepID=UPI000B507D53|nr:hypothetical protein [Methanobrevibacter sp. 87.7]OWT32588.1 hypothetical protein BGI41_06915 [Methanobrevibacter sp. 87.7]
MTESEISSYLTIKKDFSGETLKLEENDVKVQTRSDDMMIIHYKAPMYKTIELEMFFEDFNQTELLTFNIGDTGEIDVRYRGLIDAKDSLLPKYYDHKILLLQESRCRKRGDLKNIKKTSTFIPNYTLSKGKRKHPN